MYIYIESVIAIIAYIAAYMHIDAVSKYTQRRYKKQQNINNICKQLR